MQNYKLLLFDLDGTLLRSDKSISDHTINVLEQCRQRGMLIGVSTSRSEKNSLQYLTKLNPEILICSGGAVVKLDVGKNQKTGQQLSGYIYVAEFSVEETRRMIREAREICGEDCEITIDTLKHHYWNYKIDPKQQLDPSWEGSNYTDYADFSEKALKICVEIKNPSLVSAFTERFPNCDCVKFVDGDWYKFTLENATKEFAILRAGEACGIGTENIIAFGDDLVDIGMLKLCGKGVAMGNALEEVKKAADVTIGSNDEDGIAEYLVWLLDISADNKT